MPLLYTLASRATTSALKCSDEAGTIPQLASTSNLSSNGKNQHLETVNKHEINNSQEVLFRELVATLRCKASVTQFW